MSSFRDELRMEVKEYLTLEIILNMIELGYPDEEIARCLMVSTEKVTAVRNDKTV